MAQGKIRNGLEDSEQIPLKPPIWFMVVTIDVDGNIQNKAYQSNKTDLINLGGVINSFIQENIKYKIFGVWTGNWNTDLFEMNTTVLIRRLKEAGYWDFTTRRVK